MMLPLAHAGHVLMDLPIFLGPVAMLTLWLGWMKRRDSRLDGRTHSGAGERAERDGRPR